MKHFATTKHQPEQQDDAALFSRRNVELARAHLATMAPERRAQLQREWDADPVGAPREIVL